MELQMAALPLVTDLGLFVGEGWKSLADSTELCFQVPIHLPQLLSTPDAGQFERQTYSDPYLSEDSHPSPGNVKRGSSGHSPPWQWSVARRQYLIQWEHSENGTRKREKGQKSQKPNSRIGANFFPRQISASANSCFGVCPKQFPSPKRMGWGRGCVDVPSFPWPGFGSPRLGATVGQTGMEAEVRATGATAISLGDARIVVSHAGSPLFHLMLTYSRKRVKPQVVSKKSYQVTS